MEASAINVAGAIKTAMKPRSVPFEELTRVSGNVDPHFIASAYRSGLRVFANDPGPAREGAAAFYRERDHTLRIGPGQMLPDILTHELYHVRQQISPSLALPRAIGNAAVGLSALTGGVGGLLSGTGFVSGAREAVQRTGYNVYEYTPSILGAAYPQWAKIGNRMSFGNLPEYLQTPQMMSFLR
jgi:hypothetical protein